MFLGVNHFGMIQFEAWACFYQHYIAGKKYQTGKKIISFIAKAGNDVINSRELCSVSRVLIARNGFSSKNRFTFKKSFQKSSKNFVSKSILEVRHLFWGRGFWAVSQIQSPAKGKGRKADPARRLFFQNPKS